MTLEQQQRLSEGVVKQVLARAAQLDASDRAGVSIPELRTAAMEAGISASALDRALGEIAGPPPAYMVGASVRPGQPRGKRARRVLAVTAVIVTLLGAWAMLRSSAPVAPGETRVEVPSPR